MEKVPTDTFRENILLQIMDFVKRGATYVSIVAVQVTGCCQGSSVVSDEDPT